MSIERKKRMKFNELSEEEDNGLYNSNMLNLVSAVKGMESELRELEKMKTFLTTHIAEIKAYAEGPEDAILNTTKIKELFDKAFKARKQAETKDRW